MRKIHIQHAKVLELASLFQEQGKQFFLVGGTVRDSLLGHHSPDIDCTTDATPSQIRKIVQPSHPDAVVTIGEKFGTIRLLYDNHAYEITTFRGEVYEPGSRKPTVSFGTSLTDDLARRDFTINAVAYNPLNEKLFDLFGGVEDLENKLIRAVGAHPDERFLEDPLRLMRAIRFAVQLNFTIEDQTFASIQRCAKSLQTISHERIRDEMNKILLSAAPSRGIRLLVDTGLMQWIIPEVLALRGVDQAELPHKHKDVYEHVLRVIERSSASLSTRWSALLHDIGKPATRTVEHGHVHFIGHEDVGAMLSRSILKNLRFDAQFIRSINTIVRLHMRVNAYTDEWTDGAVRRLMLDAGDTISDLLDLSRADISSYREEKIVRGEQRVETLRARIQRLQEESAQVPLKSPLDGIELMEIFHRPAGPWLKEMKAYLLNLVVEGELHPDEKLRAQELALQYAKAHLL